jgi:Tfp pilus assembly protein FimT
MLLLGLILSLAVPSLSSTLEYMKLKADANKMAQFLRLARQDAVTNETVSRVVFYADSNRYKVYDSSHPTGVCYLLNNGIIIEGTTSFQTRFGVGDTPRVCVFNPAGVPSGGGAVILRNRNNKILYVIVNAVAGRVRISEDPPDNWQDEEQ